MKNISFHGKILQCNCQPVKRYCIIVDLEITRTPRLVRNDEGSLSFFFVPMRLLDAGLSRKVNQNTERGV